MRRTAALRLLGGMLSTSVLGACSKLACADSPVAASFGASPTPTQFGSQIYQSDDVDRAVALIAGCGGTMVRIGFNRNLDFADRVCAAAARKNIRVILISDSAQQPVQAESYAQSYASLYARYAHYNPVWEIWNEPNLIQYWQVTPNVDDYSRLAIETGKALRAAGAQDVWSGGVSGLDVGWIRRMKDNGVFDVLNGCAIHSYDFACDAFNQYLALKGRVPGLEFHTTETCLPSVISIDQASFLRQMWYVHRYAGIRTMIWCEFRDGTAGNHGPWAFPYGLVDNAYTRKEAYFAAQQVTASARPNSV